MKKFGKEINQRVSLVGSFIAKEKENQPPPIVDLYYGCETTLKDNGVPFLVLPDFGTGSNGTTTKTGVAEEDKDGINNVGDFDGTVTKSFHQSMTLSYKGAMNSQDSSKSMIAPAAAVSNSHLDVPEGNNADDISTKQLSESSIDDTERSSKRDDEAEAATAAETAALDAFECSEAKDVIMSQLRARGKTLTSSQLRYISLQIKGEICTAHLLTLVVYSSHGWRSFDDMDPSTHPVVTPLSEIILCDQILRDLENKFGSKLVRAACGFITWAKHGVSGAHTLLQHPELLFLIFSHPPIHRCIMIQRNIHLFI